MRNPQRNPRWGHHRDKAKSSLKMTQAKANYATRGVKTFSVKPLARLANRLRGYKLNNLPKIRVLGEV